MNLKSPTILIKYMGFNTSFWSPYHFLSSLTRYNFEKYSVFGAEIAPNKRITKNNHKLFFQISVDYEKWLNLGYLPGDCILGNWSDNSTYVTRTLFSATTEVMQTRWNT